MGAVFQIFLPDPICHHFPRLIVTLSAQRALNCRMNSYAHQKAKAIMNLGKILLKMLLRVAAYAPFLKPCGVLARLSHGDLVPFSCAYVRPG